MIEYSYLLGNSIADVHHQQSAIHLLPFLVAASSAAALWFFWLLKEWLWNTKTTSKTKSIAILGRKASGKTTLWNRLRNYKFSARYEVTSKNKIEQFTIKVEDKEVIIQATKDIGGGKIWVREYEELIKEGTFILFLVDVTEQSEDARNDIRARVQKIIDIVYTNKLDSVGFRLYITHSDEYLSRNPGATNAMIIENTKKWLDLESINVPKKVPYEYYAVNLSCDGDIDTIKKNIIDSVYE